MTNDKLMQFFEVLVSGLVVAHILTSEQKPRTESEPPQFEHLAPPGIRTYLHDNSVSWHGDQLHIPGVDEWL